MPQFKLVKSILFRDDAYLIINKPEGLSSLAEHTAPVKSLHDYLKESIPGARLCHRLDKYTSGCLLVALNDEAYRHAAIQFQERKVQKVYETVVHGKVGWEEKEVNLPIHKKKNQRAEISHAGKAAFTRFELIQNYRHFAHLRALPSSGRYHQIRIHLAALNNPICGDEAYGGKLPYLSEIKRNYRSSGRDENPMIQRFALHAEKLSFEDPGGKKIAAHAPLSPDVKVLIKLLDKYDKS